MTQISYHIIRDESMMSVIYGVEASDGEAVHRLTTDFREINALVESFNQFQLSSVHLYEAVEDFRRT